MKVPQLATNLIGSFPLTDNAANFKKAIDDQFNAGLDYVSYPQLADMNEMFLDPTVDGHSFRREGKKFVANEDFEPRVTKEVRRWVEDAHDILRRKNRFVPLRACVTGPFTLASAVSVEGLPQRPFPLGYVEMLVEQPWLLERLTRYVRKIASAYSELSEMVSIDEPFLSVLVGRRKNLLELRTSKNEASEIILEALDEAAGGIRTVASTHVCGTISPQLAELLLETDFQVLSHEFSNIERNYESYPPEELEGYSKILSVGVVSTKPVDTPDGVEPVDTIERRMLFAVNRYGPDAVIFSPDCGFRQLLSMLGEERGYNLTMNKIKNLVQAKKSVGVRLGLVTQEKER